MRSLYLHQLILHDPSPNIHDELVVVMKYLEDALKKAKNHELLVLFYLEKIQIHLQLYSETSEVKDLVEKIHSRLHLKEVELDGNLRSYFSKNKNMYIITRLILQDGWENVLVTNIKMSLN